MEDVPVCREDKDCPFIGFYGGRPVCLKKQAEDFASGEDNHQTKVLKIGSGLVIATNHCIDQLVGAEDPDKDRILKDFLGTLHLSPKH